MEYELKLASGKKVVWDGKDAIDAARRFVDCHRQETVIAWRNFPRYGIFIGFFPITETAPEGQGIPENRGPG